MKVRRLNKKGIKKMGLFLDSLNTDAPMPYPENLLTDNDFTEIIEPGIEIEKRTFTNRYEVGEYFFKKFNSSGITDIERDKGLWAWLSLYYFEEFCDKDRDGNLSPGERARWIPAISNFRKYYRHLIAGPYRIWNAYSENPKTALVLLCKPPYRPGDVVEQLSARQEWITNSAIMKAATALYVNKEETGHKRGAAGKGPGSSRRLSDIFWQFDLTWDLYSLSAKQILDLLPNEFSKFLN
jgi:hypothetical protein